MYFRQDLLAIARSILSVVESSVIIYYDENLTELTPMWNIPFGVFMCLLNSGGVTIILELIGFYQRK